MYRTEFDVENKIWSGNVIASLYNPNISVGQVLLWMLQRNPTKIAQVNVKNVFKWDGGQVGKKCHFKKLTMELYTKLGMIISGKSKYTYIYIIFVNFIKILEWILKEQKSVGISELQNIYNLVSLLVLNCL